MLQTATAILQIWHIGIFANGYGVNGLEQDRRLLERLCEWAGLTPSRLGDEAGLASTTVSRPLSGNATTRLSAPTLDKLRRRFPDFPGWNEHLPASRMGEERLAWHGQKPEPDPDMVEIAQIDLGFGLGGTFMDEEIGDSQVERRSFPRSWLRQITTSAPSQLYWARGIGNSMEPAIGDGDIILIDRSQATLTYSDLCWAFAYGQTGMVKRLRPMPDGSVKILSDNDRVPPEIAYDGELHIFGRVIAVVRRL